MELVIQGMRAVVAGGSRGIGRSIALALAANGASVSICARRAQALESTRDELARAAQPCLERSPRASIINISSISAFMPSVREPAYAAAKAALIQFTTSQALALAPRKIRVNCVAPGSIEFQAAIGNSAGPAIRCCIATRSTASRWAVMDASKRSRMWRTSGLASWVTGHMIVADGGQLLEPWNEPGAGHARPRPPGITRCRS